MKMKIIISTIIWLAVSSYSAMLYALPAQPFDQPVHLLNIEPKIEFEIINAPNNTWGYDILKDKKIFIHQPNRPGLPGKEGFKTKKDAIKVAQLVILKIKKGEMPPTVSSEELKALKLTN